MKNLIFAALVIFLGAAATTVWAEPPATQPAKELTLDLGNKVTLKLVQIPAGKFTMGSPDDEKKAAVKEAVAAGIPEAQATDAFKDEVQHEVTISKPFYMGVTHVTVDQFAAFVKDSGYKTDAEKAGWSIGFEIKDGKIDTQEDGRLLVAQSEFRSEGGSSGGAGKLERRQGVLRLAVEEERQDGGAADGGAVGIRLPCRDEDGVSVGRQSR